MPVKDDLFVYCRPTAEWPTAPKEGDGKKNTEDSFGSRGQLTRSQITPTVESEKHKTQRRE